MTVMFCMSSIIRECLLITVVLCMLHEHISVSQSVHLNMFSFYYLNLFFVKMKSVLLEFLCV